MIYANPADMPPRSNEEQLDFFDLALATSERAAASSLTIEKDMIVAGQRIRLRFTGDTMATATMRALLPLCVPVVGEPDATFLVWDSASTNHAMPAPPLSNLCFSQRGDLWTFRSPRVRSAFHYWDYSLNLYDRERRIGIFWFRTRQSCQVGRARPRSARCSTGSCPIAASNWCMARSWETRPAAC
jgi:hypothetical protein